LGRTLSQPCSPILAGRLECRIVKPHGRAPAGTPSALRANGQRLCLLCETLSRDRTPLAANQDKAGSLASPDGPPAAARSHTSGRNCPSSPAGVLGRLVNTFVRYRWGSTPWRSAEAINV